MIKRTDGEVKAYVDGYNACYDEFVKILLGRNGVNTAIRKMEMLKTAVNNVLLSEGSNLSAQESDSSDLMSREWIPCKERLPEQDGWYLVSLGNEWTKDGFGDIHGEGKIYDSDVRLSEFRDGKWYHGMVAAWMPKPGPYKEETE